MNEWLRVAADGRITLTLHIQPGAKKTEFAGLHGDALKIRLAAPPVDGKANDALIKFVAETLKLPKSAVTLKSGQTSRRKGLTAQLVRATTKLPNWPAKETRIACIMKRSRKSEQKKLTTASSRKMIACINWLPIICRVPGRVPGRL